MRCRSTDKLDFINAVGSYSVRMKSNGAMTVLPAGAEDMGEPSWREMFKENRHIRKKLLKLKKKGMDVDSELDFVRRRARWIQHELLKMASI